LRALRNPGFQYEFVHDAQDLLVRLDHARRVEVLANLAEHVAQVGINRAKSERLRIQFRVSARERRNLLHKPAERRLGGNMAGRALKITVHRPVPLAAEFRRNQVANEWRNPPSCAWPKAPFEVDAERNWPSGSLTPSETAITQCP
jgi:hypothetical protein